MLSKISITGGARPGGETLQPGNSLLGPDLIIYETVKNRNEWDGKIWKVLDNDPQLKYIYEIFIHEMDTL